VFCMHGVALAEPFAGGLLVLVVAHPQITRVARSTPAAPVRFIMRNPPTDFKKAAILPGFYRDFSGCNKRWVPRTLEASRRANWCSARGAVARISRRDVFLAHSLASLLGKLRAAIRAELLGDVSGPGNGPAACFARSALPPLASLH
jgi:hypothetical protein